jgi:subtilase family serine protease
MRRSRSTLLSPLTLSALILSFLICSTGSFAADRISGAISSQQRVKLSSGVSSKAKPEFDEGPVDPSLRLSFVTMHIAPTASQQLAINRLLAQQQDSGSPLYHKWLTPEQYADQFSLSPNDVQKINAWLLSEGFTVVKVARSRNLIAFSGTAGRIEAVFQTPIHNFTVNGEKHISNTAPPSIPAALAGVVTTVGGLNDFRPKAFFQRRNPNYSFPIPHSSEYAPLIAPGDIATIYNITPLYQASTPIIGTNQKLVVVGQTDVYLADLNDFRSGFELPSISCTTDSNDIITACTDPHFQYVLNGTVDAGVNPQGDDLAEADIDLEWSGAIAYGAQIIFVNSGGTANGVWDAWQAAVTDNLAPVITMSYGICELGEAQGDVGGNTFSTDEPLLQQAALEGITFMNSSGDAGAAACDANPPGTTNTFTPTPPYLAAENGLSVNFPASSPEVTAVGGTMIPISELSDPGTYWSATTTLNGGGSAVCANSGPCIPEVGWNDDQEYGLYCAANPSDTDHCVPGGKGQVTITSPQTFQEDFWIGASTGGPSNCYTLNGSGICDGGYPQPTWQQNLDIPGQTTNTHVTAGVSAVRFVPDVSLLSSADFPGYIICTAQSEVGGSSSASTCAGGGTTGISNSISTYSAIFGGTSFASPIFAGMVTLLNQYLDSGTPGLGSINKQLYSLAKNSPTAFNQVTGGDNFAAGSNIVYYCDPGSPSTFPAAYQCASTGPDAGTMGYAAASADPSTGYNLVTGLGSVNLNNLAAAWAAAETSSSITVRAGSATISYAQSVTLTATVLPSTATGQVTFLVNGTALGSPVTVTGASAGVATLSTTQLPVGTDNITASFSGSGYNTASTTLSPAVVNVTPAAFTFATSSTSHTVLAGQTTLAYNFTVTPTSASTFAGPVTFSCSFSPADTTLTNSNCDFSPSSIAGGFTVGQKTVTMTIKTAGPNTGAGANVRRGADNRAPWLPFTFPIAGVIAIGLMSGKLTRKASRGSAIALLCFSLLLIGFMIACGGGSSSTPPPPVTVSVTPSTVSLYADESSVWPATATQQQFTATVNNSTNQTVTWAVTGGSANGTISSTGLYTAPTTVPNPASATVTATSTAATAPGSGAVTILAPTATGTFTVTVTATETGATSPAPTQVSMVVQ